jgi:ferrous iron transport protein B
MNLWRRILSTLGFNGSAGGCHGAAVQKSEESHRKVAIVGSPNVGKSMVFNRLTGAYVVVSNYPGTTVDVSKGKAKIGGEEMEIVDTPGMYSLLPITEEERVARLLLFEEGPAVILHVVDSRNLERMLPLTLQLIEAGLPIILDLNMMDESEAAGIEIDVDRLEGELGIPVVATVATSGQGMDALRRKIAENVGDQKYADRV